MDSPEEVAPSTDDLAFIGDFPLKTPENESTVVGISIPADAKIIAVKFVPPQPQRVMMAGCDPDSAILVFYETRNPEAVAPRAFGVARSGAGVKIDLVKPQPDGRSTIGSVVRWVDSQRLEAFHVFELDTDKLNEPQLVQP